MATQFTSSNDFAALVKQLQQSPEDFYLKTIIVRHWPQIREWGKTNPLALYHLAHAYAPNSAQYKQTMLQSADLGCTNAMLAASQFLAQSKNPADQEKAAHYLKMIEHAGDSYIQKHAQELLDEHPQLSVAIQSQPVKAHAGHHNQRFFITESVFKGQRTAVEHWEAEQLRP